MSTDYNETYVEQIKERVDSISKLFSLQMTSQKLQDLSRKNRLPFITINFILELYKIIEEVYPGKVDIHYDLSPKFKIYRNQYGSNHIKEIMMLDKLYIDKIYLVIHFPEFTITNSRKHELNITDLFVRIPIDIMRNRPMFSKIQGTRTTMTIPEFIIGYWHSHLPSRVLSVTDLPLTFTTFCTGSGEINSITQLINSSDKIDYDLIKLLLHQISSFVKWESLEGQPYIRMEAVVLKSYDYSVLKLEDCIKASKRVLKSYRLLKQLDYSFYNGKFIVVDNHKLDDTLVEAYSDSGHLLSSAMIVYKDEKGKYFQKKEVPENFLVGNSDWIPFRGKKVFFKVEGEQKTTTINNSKGYLHPQIKNYVKHQLEISINNSSLKESLLR